MNVNKNLIVAAVLVLVLVVGGVVWYNKYKTFDPSVDTKTFKTAGEFENYYKNLDELYKKDTYGGATPEATLALFIDALKKGDTDLAAKYFVPEKQKQEAESLLRNKGKGFLEAYIKIIAGDKKGVRFADDSTYEFDFFDKNNEQIHTGHLILNKATNVWKIEGL